MKKVSKPRAWLSWEDAKTPRDGEVITNRWWVCDSEKGLLFIRFPGQPPSFVPQCNLDQRITDRIRSKLYPDLEYRLVDVVYLNYDRNIKVEDL